MTQRNPDATKLTREQIESAAGRELDALVAEHVMGWKRMYWPESGNIVLMSPDAADLVDHTGEAVGTEEKPNCRDQVEFYSADHNAAFEVKAELRKRHYGHAIVHMYFDECRAQFWKDEKTYECRNSDERIAICRASLLALLEGGA